MKIKRILICLLFGVTSLHAEDVVNFEKTNNIKALFDANLRPWRLHGLENSTLYLENIKQLPIKLSGLEVFHVNASRASCKVLPGNDIYFINFFGDIQTLDEAGASARKILTELKLNTVEFDAQIQSLKNRGPRGMTQKDDQGMGARILSSNDIEISIALRPGLDYDGGIYAHLNVYIQFPLNGRIARSSQFPIQPPAGYEHISLEEPKRAVDPNKKQFPSREQMDAMDDLSKTLKKTLANNNEAKQAVQNFIEANDPEFQVKAQKNRESLRFWIIAGAITATLVSIGAWMRYRRNNKSKT